MLLTIKLRSFATASDARRRKRRSIRFHALSRGHRSLLDCSQIRSSFRKISDPSISCSMIPGLKAFGLKHCGQQVFYIALK